MLILYEHFPKDTFFGIPHPIFPYNGNKTASALGKEGSANMKSKKAPTSCAGSAHRHGFLDLLKHAAIGAGGGLILCTAGILIGSALCLLSKDPIALALPVGRSLLYLSAAMGGWITARLHKGAYLPCGFLCGGLLCVFFWILTFFLEYDEPRAALPLSLLLRLLTVGASMAGALLATKKKQSHPSRRHR